MGKVGGVFSLNKTSRGSGRGSGGKPTAKPLIVPKAGSLQPKAAAASSGGPVEAPVQLTILRRTSVASKAIEDFGDEPLWQIQLKHDGRPMVTMQLIRNLTEYLNLLRQTDACIPTNLQELRQQAGIVLQLAGGTVPWRAACYVAGASEALENALQLVLGFVEHRWSHPGAGEKSFPGSLAT